MILQSRMLTRWAFSNILQDSQDLEFDRRRVASPQPMLRRQTAKPKGAVPAANTFLQATKPLQLQNQVQRQQ